RVRRRFGTAIELGRDDLGALLEPVAIVARRGDRRVVPVAGEGGEVAARDVLLGHLLVALDRARRVLGERALGAAVLVLAAVGVHDRERDLLAIGLGPEQVALAVLPQAEADADRARERDVERDAE